jgi:hypothetical protein
MIGKNCEFFLNSAAEDDLRKNIVCHKRLELILSNTVVSAYEQIIFDEFLKTGWKWRNIILNAIWSELR